jgi:hypothetical protein
VTTLDGTTRGGQSPDRRRTSEWGGTATEWQIGMWSARVLFGIGVAYAITLAAGFSAMASFSKPLQDPYLAVAEALILLMAPTMVMLMVVVHICAPERIRICSINALGWMLLAAGFTVTVHLVELTVVRRIKPDAIHGYHYLFNFHWPSLLFGIDIVAWDIFFALAILFAAPVFRACGHRAVSNWLLVAGALSLLGIVGPAFNHIGLREIGICGYAVVFPITCLGISRAFRRRLDRQGAPFPSANENVRRS